jgi:hypothetical protein
MHSRVDAEAAARAEVLGRHRAHLSWNEVGVGPSGGPYAQRDHAGGNDGGGRVDALPYLGDEIDPGERLDPRDHAGGHQAHEQHAGRPATGNPHA